MGSEFGHEIHGRVLDGHSLALCRPLRQGQGISNSPHHVEALKPRSDFSEEQKFHQCLLRMHSVFRFVPHH